MPKTRSQENCKKKCVGGRVLTVRSRTVHQPVMSVHAQAPSLITSMRWHRIITLVATGRQHSTAALETLPRSQCLTAHLAAKDAKDHGVAGIC
jgi:hypothetical protein